MQVGAEAWGWWVGEDGRHEWHRHDADTAAPDHGQPRQSGPWGSAQQDRDGARVKLAWYGNSCSFHFSTLFGCEAVLVYCNSSCSLFKMLLIQNTMHLNIQLTRARNKVLIWNGQFKLNLIKSYRPLRFELNSPTLDKHPPPPHTSTRQNSYRDLNIRML